MSFDANRIEEISTFSEDLPVVGSPFMTPSARNAFYIESGDGKEEGRSICYGDTIHLRLAEKTQDPLYVEVNTLNLGSETGNCGFPTAKLKKGKTNNGR